VSRAASARRSFFPAGALLGVSDRLFFLVEGVCAALFLGSVLVLVGDIASRAVLNQSTSWAAEIVRYAIIWMVFLGAGVAARKGAHIAIRVFAELLPGPVARLFDTAMGALGIVAGAALCFYGAALVEVMAGFNQTSPAARLPMWGVYLALPVGGGLIVLGFLCALVELWTRDGPRSAASAG